MRSDGNNRYYFSVNQLTKLAHLMQFRSVLMSCLVDWGAWAPGSPLTTPLMHDNMAKTPVVSAGVECSSEMATSCGQTEAWPSPASAGVPQGYRPLADWTLQAQSGHGPNSHDPTWLNNNSSSTKTTFVGSPTLKFRLNDVDLFSGPSISIHCGRSLRSVKNKRKERFINGVFKIAITRSAVCSSKCTTNRLVAGLCPDPLRELTALSQISSCMD